MVDKVRLDAKKLAEELKSDSVLLDLMFPPRYMDINEASVFIRIPVKTIYAKLREIPHSKIGKKLIFSDRDLSRYVEMKREVMNPGMKVVSSGRRKAV